VEGGTYIESWLALRWVYRTVKFATDTLAVMQATDHRSCVEIWGLEPSDVGSEEAVRRPRYKLDSSRDVVEKDSNGLTLPNTNQIIR
jgi:hypothetical protein